MDGVREQAADTTFVLIEGVTGQRSTLMPVVEMPCDCDPVVVGRHAHCSDCGGVVEIPYVIDHRAPID